MEPFYTNFINRVLLEASTIASFSFGKVSNTTKAGDNNQVLTETDLAIGKFLVSQVEAAYPSHNVIDEEAGIIDKQSRYTWVIDPIDGTSNFANGVPTYGIMIGLLENDVPVAGGIALPSFDQIAIAEKGGGAYLNGEKMSVSTEPELLKSLVAYAIDGHQEDPEITRQECELLGKIVLAVRNIRSSNSVFDAVMISKGSYGGYLNRTSKIWDNVAQQIIFEEAGGTYTDFFGQPMDYSRPLERTNENYTWCMAPRQLHGQLQAIMRG